MLSQLEELLQQAPAADVRRRGDAVLTGITHDSRQVRAGDLYAVVPGAGGAGRAHAAEAVSRGAAALLVQRELDLPLPQLVVRRVRPVLGAVSAAVLGRPADQLRLVGVTGTNGKSTTTLLLHGALLAAGRVPGVIGTLGARLGGRRRASALTTPEAPELHALLRWMADGGADDVVLEVSSIGLEQGRVDGLCMDLAVHTGLEEEHLDFHGTVEQYWASKAALFSPDRARRGLVRVDDPWGVRLARQARIPVTTFGEGPDADVRLTDVRTGLAGTSVTLSAAGTAAPQESASAAEKSGSAAQAPVRLTVPLLGRVNAVNAAAAYLAARHLGLTRIEAARGLAGAVAPPGRHSLVVADGAPLVVVDFAHTPAALEALIETGRDLTAPGGRVLLVFGGRGERDRAKRADLGRTAAAADLLVLTRDTTEREDVSSVLAEYRLGLLGSSTPVVVEPDRRRAIALAVAEGAPGDVVLVAGRGSEHVLRTGGRTERFVDREVVAQLLDVADLEQLADPAVT